MTPSPDDTPRPSRFPVLADVNVMAPFRWLSRGARDLRAQPWPSLFYGLCFAAMGWALGALLRSSPGLMMALTGGFLLLGPFLAMGLYEVARQREAGGRCDLFESTVAWGRNLSNIAILGIALGVLLALWARSSMMVIAFAFPYRMPDAALLIDALVRGEELGFLAAWFAVGAVFAALVFAFTVIALPLMLDRGTDAITAMLASVACVARNPGAMMVWAACIVMLIVAGFATAFVGLVVAGPWLGLATWHAYRELVCAGDTDR
ncbi:MAG: DUF2189 domain-containing protein [Burkholderiales bacterium]|jgi:uncharacterized membrane protein